MTTTSASTTAGSAVSTLITSLGAGSGTDMTALAANLAAAQFAGRTDRLTARSEKLDRQISAAANLKSMVLSLASSLGDRVRAGDLSPQPKLANAAVATASLSGTGAPSGSYTLEVTALAAAQTLASPVYANSSATVGAGTLTLRFGTVLSSGFTQDGAHAPVNIAVAAGATLADVAAAITAQGAGVSAYVANTTSGARLVLKGADGAANGFVLDAVETPGQPGLAALAWSPPDSSGRLLGQAADAAFSVDGLAMTSASNTVIDAVPGVTLKLSGTNPGAPTRLDFASPTAAIGSAMQDLTAALNQIAAELRTGTDPLSGDLARDAGARALRSALSQLAGKTVMPNAATGAARTLADLGLSTKRDGGFALDTARLSATLAADPTGAAAMFTTGLYGIFATIDATARTVTSASNPGSLAGSVSRYTSQKTQTSADQTKLAAQQEALRSSMVARFAATDTRVGASRATLSFLQNQIDAWNAKN